MINNNLIWIDLEMTGIDPKKHKILEIATVITDSELNILEEGPSIQIHQSEYQLSLMNSWNVKTHNSNNLIYQVKNSNFNEKDAEIKTLKFLKKWVNKKSSPICGNSVGHDRIFLFHYMPILEQFFHYRYLDVSSIKELILRWRPEILTNFKKKNVHRAMDDVHESIKELKFYRNFLFF